MWNLKIVKNTTTTTNTRKGINTLLSSQFYIKQIPISSHLIWEMPDNKKRSKGIQDLQQPMSALFKHF